MKGIARGSASKLQPIILAPRPGWRRRGGPGRAGSNVRCRCGTLFSDDEPRCPHCGRRVQTVLLPDAVAGAVAAEPQPEARHAQASSAPPAAPKQAHLFGSQKVIPFEALVSTRRQYGRRREPARDMADARAQTRSMQPALELRPPAAARPAASYGDASIAPPGLRAEAALFDLACCGLGAALFAATFRIMGGEFGWSAQLAPWYAGAACAIGLFYHLFFALLGRDTAGAVWCGLRVVTFDGFAPEWRLRVARLIAAVVGMAAVGLGPLWVLVDDESLSWHDQITKTFPTPHK